MKKIICIALMLFCVSAYAVQKTKPKTGKITKQETQDNYAPNYLTLKYDVSGIFSKSLTVTVLNTNPNFAYINTKFEITYYDDNGMHIGSKKINLTRPLLPNYPEVFSVDIEPPSTCKTVRLFVYDADLLRYVAPKPKQKKPIVPEWG